MPAGKNPSGLDEPDVRDAMALASAILGFSGGSPDDRSRRLARRILRGTSSHESAVRHYLDATLPEVQ